MGNKKSRIFIVSAVVGAEVLAELRAYRMDNNFKFAEIYRAKIDQMNSAKI